MLRQALLRRGRTTARPPCCLSVRPCLQRLQRRLSVSSSGSGSGPVQFGRLAAALPGYVKEHGHGWVPRVYVVRDADGYTMGKDAERARSLARKGTLGAVDEGALRDEGLAWEQGEHRWDRVVRALFTFGELHSTAGWLLVPHSFVVPSGAPWHKMCWGMRLGNAVASIRSQEVFVKDRPERREWLDEMRFVWDELEHRWTEQVQPALRAYREANDDLRVPNSFVVPSEAPWPEACWGMNLGETVHGIRLREVFVKDKPERRAWLDDLGFVWRAKSP